MPKVYLHYEGPRGPSHTFVWNTGRDVALSWGSLDKALPGFVESYVKKHGLDAYGDGEITYYCTA